MKTSAKAILLAIPLLGTACASSSASFVEERTTYSVTKGRLMAIEGLTSQKITKQDYHLVFIKIMREKTNQNQMAFEDFIDAMEYIVQQIVGYTK